MGIETQQIKEIDATIFNYLMFKLMELGLDSDRRNFQEIREILNKQPRFSPEEFAYECFYVVCVAGFKQDYAKAMCNRIIKFIEERDYAEFTEEELLKIYSNGNKVRAIKQLWDRRKCYCDEFYKLNDIDEKVKFLGTLPHVGNITKYHLARNLGLNFVKYDIWIQRLGVALYGTEEFENRVNNSHLLLEIKAFCDSMFSKLQKETGEKVGFIDVVLWRSCQKKLLKISRNSVFLVSESEIDEKYKGG